MSNPTCFHMSATAIAAFKACPTRFRLGYREGLRLAEDTDAQRVGTNWHSLHEVYQNAVVEWKMSGGIGYGERLDEYATARAIEHLNERYATIPDTKTPEEWETEREILVTSFIAYLWYWENDPIEPIVNEWAFELPLYSPRVGLPLPTSEVLRVGRVDHICVWQGMIGNVERKSTSRSIDPSGTYWEKARKDTQVSMYAAAFREAKTLPDAVLNNSAFDPNRLGNTLYDVWHKPTIKPAALSQADTKALIESGQYCGREFLVLVKNERTEGEGKEAVVTADIFVDEVAVEITPGKKGYAIARETPGMFAARLMEDITSRPEFYFQRQEIARTDKDLARFRVELFNIYQAMRMYDKSGCWFENEQQCRATFTCQYVPICYGQGSPAVCDGETTPAGFKRIFTDLTVHNRSIEEGD